jgi:hypothetical protein
MHDDADITAVLSTSGTGAAPTAPVPLCCAMYAHLPEEAEGEPPHEVRSSDWWPAVGNRWPEDAPRL